MINGEYVAQVNGNPLIVTMADRRIVKVMRPDGYTYVPKNPRHIKRLKSQAPPDTTAELELSPAAAEALLLSIFGKEE